MTAPKLQAVSLRKEYPGTTALDDVSLGFEGGRVHALIGKNGAGKSTLVKIFAGAVQPTAGQVLVEGRPVRLRGPRDALHQGIVTVYQELSLVSELTVGENILFGRLPGRGPGGWIIDWPEVFRRSRQVLDELGVTLDVRARVSRLGIARQQLVEIAKAMSFRPRVLMLDEPTSALAHREVQRLFALVRRLAAQGVAVIYISHRLNELPQVADTVSVLRDGRHAGTIAIGDASPERIAEMMFGQRRGDLQSSRARSGAIGNRPYNEMGTGTSPQSHSAAPRGSRHTPCAVGRLEIAPTSDGTRSVPATPPVLEVRNLGRGELLRNVSFKLYPGEVLGIAGMLGSGRSELLMSLFGADPRDAGEVLLDGRPLRRNSLAEAKRRGLALTPEDRKRQALVLGLSVRDNLCLAALRRIAWHGLIWKGRQRPLVRRLIERLHVALASAEQPVAALSGGNQQKVVLGNWLATEPRVMLLDEPTRGIDVLAKRQMFEIVGELSRQGIAAIFVSSELEELFEVCHRILVLHKGQIVADWPAAEAQLDRLMRACMEGRAA